MKELIKYFTLLLVICVVHALISIDLICYAQDKNEEKHRLINFLLLGVGMRRKPGRS